MSEKYFNMEKDKLQDIVENLDHKPNKDLDEALKSLNDEYNKTKDLIVSPMKEYEKIYDIIHKGEKEHTYGENMPNNHNIDTNKLFVVRKIKATSVLNHDRRQHGA